MTDTEVRIACVQAAAATPGNPNHVQMARAYYDFVTEGSQEPATTTPKTATKAGARK